MFVNCRNLSILRIEYCIRISIKKNWMSHPFHWCFWDIDAHLSRILIMIYYLPRFFLLQMMWLTSLALTVVLVTVVVAQGEIWEDDDREILIRSQRGAKNRDKRKLFSKHVFLKLHPHADSNFRSSNVIFI